MAAVAFPSLPSSSHVDGGMESSKDRSGKVGHLFHPCSSQGLKQTALPR